MSTRISEDRQFNIWEQESDPQWLWMRCNICCKQEKVAFFPAVHDPLGPILVFLAHHEDCYFEQGERNVPAPT